MNINIEKIPFSRYGSTLAVSSAGNELYLRGMYGQWNDDRIFKLIPMKDGHPVQYEFEVFPWSINIKSGSGTMRIYMKGNDSVVFEGNGLGLMLDGGEMTIGYACRKRKDRYIIAEYKNEFFIDVQTVHGTLKVISQPVLTVAPENDKFTVYLHMSEEEHNIPAPYIDVIGDISALKSEYENWIHPLMPDNPVYRETSELALYIMWSSVMYPKGYMTRPTMLMSKNWMHYVWSWDHCFNALGVSDAYNELAKDQLFVVFDNQAKNGKLPDMVHHKFVQRLFTKPPIHGWCIKKLINKGCKFEADELQKLYYHLVLWTNWWFAYRDYDADGICQYDHGNDCGWDNCTAFDGGISVESPDLTAYLLLQMKCLSELAVRIGADNDAIKWNREYEVLYSKFIQHFWKENMFVSYNPENHEEIETKTLLNFLPIVLGDSLPSPYFPQLVEKLKNEDGFFTQYGMATENIYSEKFDKGNGYWRGPIWAPVTYLLVDGLDRGGEKDFAKEIAMRFCNMINGKDGIYENYSPLTGEGFDDPAYSWTASIFIMLVKEYLS